MATVPSEQYSVFGKFDQLCTHAMNTELQLKYTVLINESFLKLLKLDHYESLEKRNNRSKQHKLRKL